MRKITKIKTKYYSREILKHLLLGGVIVIAASSPYFIINLMKGVSKFKNSPKRKVLNSFDYLKRRGLIEINRRGHDIQIVLTSEGKQMAGKYQINDLEIEKPKVWDKKWRIVIFDIPSNQRMKRDVFRGKIKEFGFYPLQKSVWIYPYKCEAEIRLLRDFLGLKKTNIQVVVTREVDNSQRFKEVFKL